MYTTGANCTKLQEQQIREQLQLMSMGASHFKSFENLNINIMLIYILIHCIHMAKAEMSLLYKITFTDQFYYRISLVCECHK